MSWDVGQGEIDSFLGDLSNPEVRLNDLLQQDAIYKLLRDKNKPLINFLKDHIQDVINCCFSIRKEEGIKAFLLFTKASEPLLNAILEDDLFITEASKVFMQPSPPLFLVSRIATIILHIMKTVPTQINNCIGFLYQVLPYISEPAVLDLLQAICQPDSTLVNAQNALIESNFPVYLLNELRSTSDEDLIAAILKVIRLAGQNDVLKKHFSTHNFILNMYTLINMESTTVNNELWWAITAIACTENVNNMIIFIPKAIENISEPYDKALRFRIFSIEFIAKMLKLKSTGLTEFLNMQIQQVVLRLIVQFPDSSNLIGAVFRLINYGIQWDIFAETLIDHFLPVLVVEASSKIRNAVSAESMRLLVKLNKNSKKKKKYSEKIDTYLAKHEMYKEFCATKLAINNRIMKSNYGGDFNRYYPVKSPSSFLLY